jgi:nicotinate-nucleotide adenylyltransferase
MKLGIFGGTFDPPHVGHIVAACQAGWAAGLDEVWMVVARAPWQKEGTRPITDPAIRLRLVRAAIEGIDGLVASDIELRRDGPTYTIDTVEQIRRERPASDVSLIVGADAGAGLDTWHRAGELRDLVDIVVVNRPGHAAEGVPPGWSWRSVEIPGLEVSGTDLRRRVAAGEPIHGLTPAPVAVMIADEHLYG